MIVATYSDGKLREYAIEEADRMGVQAEAMAAAIESATERFAKAMATLKATLEELAKTEQAGRDAMLNAQEKVEQLRKERDVCFKIRDTLEQQEKDGIPFAGTLVIERDQKLKP